MLERRPFHKFTAEDDAVWATLYQRQLPQVREHMSQPWYLDGFDLLNLPADRVPDFEAMNRIFQEKVNWELFSTEEVFSNGQTWFEHLSQRQFLISEYIRDRNSLEYTPLPDIFHDAFGHLPLMTTQPYVDLVNEYAWMQLEFTPEQRKGLGSIWWYTIEFGLIEEDGRVKGFGAGLASSYGELKYCFENPQMWKPFDPKAIAEIRPSPHHFHEVYFVLESFDQLVEFLQKQHARHTTEVA